MIGQLHAPTALPPGESPHYPLGRLGGPRAGVDDMEKWKFLPPLVLEPRPLGGPARSQSLYRLSYPGSLWEVETEFITKLVKKLINAKCRTWMVGSARDINCREQPLKDSKSICFQTRRILTAERLTRTWHAVFTWMSFVLKVSWSHWHILTAVGRPHIPVLLATLRFKISQNNSLKSSFCKKIKTETHASWHYFRHKMLFYGNTLIQVFWAEYKKQKNICKRKY
jgi:hypothetical protein